MYRETHVVGTFSAADGKLLSARCARSGAPRGVVLHAVSARDAGRRTFGRLECATWVNAAAYGQLPQPQRCLRRPRAARGRHGRREGAMYRETYVVGAFSAAEGNSLSLSAAPSRGSRVPGDSCSRSIFCGGWEVPLRSLRSLRRPQRRQCSTQ